MIKTKFIASKLLENKALNMETNFEDKFWSSIVSISRVSAGKMQILWRMTRHNTLYITVLVMPMVLDTMLPQNCLFPLHTYFSRDKALE